MTLFTNLEYIHGKVVFVLCQSCVMLLCAQIQFIFGCIMRKKTIIYCIYNCSKLVLCYRKSTFGLTTIIKENFNYCLFNKKEKPQLHLYLSSLNQSIGQTVNHTDLQLTISFAAFGMFSEPRGKSALRRPIAAHYFTRNHGSEHGLRQG